MGVWIAGGLIIAYLSYRWYSGRSSSSAASGGGITPAQAAASQDLGGGGGGNQPPPVVGTTTAVDPSTGNVVDSSSVDNGAPSDSGVRTPLDPYQWYAPGSGVAAIGPSPLYAYSSGQLVGESPGLGSVFSTDKPASEGYAALGFQASDPITFVPTPISSMPTPTPIPKASAGKTYAV